MKVHRNFRKLTHRVQIVDGEGTAVSRIVPIFVAVNVISMASKREAYETPTMLVVEVKPEGILCGSPQSELNVFYPVEDL